MDKCTQDGPCEADCDPQHHGEEGGQDKALDAGMLMFVQK